MVCTFSDSTSVKEKALELYCPMFMVLTNSLLLLYSLTVSTFQVLQVHFLSVTSTTIPIVFFFAIVVWLMQWCVFPVSCFFLLCSKTYILSARICFYVHFAICIFICSMHVKQDSKQSMAWLQLLYKTKNIIWDLLYSYFVWNIMKLMDANACVLDLQCVMLLMAKKHPVILFTFCLLTQPIPKIFL